MKKDILKNSFEKRKLLIAGLLTGSIASFLVFFGNPANMGFCIACFIRDIAGATKFHTNPAVQYLRPEIIGLVLGSFIISFLFKEFRSHGGSAPVTRFVISVIVMIGALSFLGCPLRMVLRLAGGDLNALVGLLGFVAGIGTACYFINKGFNLGRSYKQRTLEGVFAPSINVLLLIVLIMFPAVLVFSTTGPASKHAPLFISLVAGLIVGVLAQKTRLCMVGGIRDIILLKDYTLLLGFVGIFISALSVNLASGNFKLGFTGQAVAHSAHVWNFAGMYAVGLGCAMLGGCPLRQLILAGEGHSDSLISVLGMFTGAVISHNFNLAASSDTVVDGVYKTGGLTDRAKAVLLFSILLLFVIAVYYSFIKEKSQKEKN